MGAPVRNKKKKVTDVSSDTRHAMRVETRPAMDAILANFNLSADAARMTASLLAHVDENPRDGDVELVLDVLGAFGFRRRDLDGLARSGAVELLP